MDTWSWCLGAGAASLGWSLGSMAGAAGLGHTGSLFGRAALMLRHVGSLLGSPLGSLLGSRAGKC